MMSMCILQHMEVIFAEKKIDNPEQETSPKIKKGQDSDSRHKFITEHIQSKAVTKTVTRDDSPFRTLTRRPEIEEILLRTP